MTKSSHPRYPWRVKCPGPDGRRESKWFRSETDALEFAEKQRKQLGQDGTRFGGMTDSEQAAILLWRGLVSEAKGQGVKAPSLLDIARDSASRWRQMRLGVTVSDAFDAFVADRKAEGASPRHVRTLQSRLRRFTQAFGKQTVGMITADAVLGWLNDLALIRGREAKVSLTTRDNFRRSLLSFFNYCRQRGWVGENPVPTSRKQKTKAARIAKAARPGILTPGEVAAFMEAIASVRTVKSGSEKDETAIYYDHDHVSYWAIKVWAGLRDAEAAALDWKHVDLDRAEITVPAEISKTGDRRVVKIEEALDAWLRPRAKRRGPVAPGSEMTRRYALKKALRILRRPDAGGKPRKFELPHNWARHSYASYHLYHFRNPGETALQLGHKGNPAMLHEHYKNPDAEREAAAFWKILPAGRPDNVTSIRQEVA